MSLKNNLWTVRASCHLAILITMKASMKTGSGRADRVTRSESLTDSHRSTEHIWNQFESKHRQHQRTKEDRSHLWARHESWTRSRQRRWPTIPHGLDQRSFRFQEFSMSISNFRSPNLVNQRWWETALTKENGWPNQDVLKFKRCSCHPELDERN